VNQLSRSGFISKAVLLRFDPALALKLKFRKLNAMGSHLRCFSKGTYRYLKQKEMLFFGVQTLCTFVMLPSLAVPLTKPSVEAARVGRIMTIRTSNGQTNRGLEI